MLPHWCGIPCLRFVFYSCFFHFSPCLPSLVKIPPKFPHWATTSRLLPCALCLLRTATPQAWFWWPWKFWGVLFAPQLGFVFLIVRLRLILGEITEAKGHFHHGLAGVHTSDVNHLCPICHGLRSYLLGTHMITFLLVLLFPHYPLRRKHCVLPLLQEQPSHPEDRLRLDMDHSIIPPIMQGCH